MDPRKTTAEWLRSTVFREEAIQPRTAQPAQRLPQALRAARSLQNGPYQSWQSRETVFLKQAKLLAGYEDDYEFQDSVTRYYPTYQSLTDPQLRGYFSWRTKLRQGEIRQTSLSFAFLYIYELLNQIGAADPEEGFRKLEAFREAYGQIDGGILPYLSRWRTDYVIYYGLNPALLADTPQAAAGRCASALEHIEAWDVARIADAIRPLSKWLGRSKFYAAFRDDVDAVAVQTLRRMSAHYATRCKKSLVEQYFGGFSRCAVYLFDAAVFCDPLKRQEFEYAVDDQCAYRCKGGLWSVWQRGSSSDAGRRLDSLLKTIDSVMREEYGYPHPIKPEQGAKWILRIIREEAQALLARKQAEEARRITINYAQLAGIRRDAAITRDKLIVDEEEAEPDPIPAPREPEPLAPAQSGGDAGLTGAEYRLLQCLLYGGDTGWVQAEGHLLSVLADGINEKLYDTFLDCVLDGVPQPIDDYIDALKGMVHP